MRNGALKCPDGPRIRAVVVASNDPRDYGKKQVSDAILNSPRRRFSQCLLELRATRFLAPTHTAFATKRTVGVVDEVTRIDVDSNIVMEWKVLAPFERLEAVDRNLMNAGQTLDFPRLN